jgi:hypothetical protein
MSWKQAKTTLTASRPVSKPAGDPLAYEMWPIGEVDHGPVEERGAAEGLVLEARQRRGPQKRSGNKVLKKNVSK